MRCIYPLILSRPLRRIAPVRTALGDLVEDEDIVVIVRDVGRAASTGGAEAPPAAISGPAIAITTCRLSFRG